MLKSVLAAGVAAALALPALAEDPAQEVPQGQVAPDAEPTENTTGGVTSNGREVIPGDSVTEPGDALESDDVATRAEESGARSGGGAVSASVVEELYQTALEQQRNAAAPAPEPTEESVREKARAIQAHRDALFDRVANRV